MRKPTWILRLAALWVASVLATPVLGRTLFVTPNGQLAKIQAALSLAEPGDRVVVKSGVYAESGIVIDKAVELVGEGWPVIDGTETGQIITVVADSVRISGFVIQNVGVSFMEDRAGIKLVEVKECVVENNRFIQNFFGIYLENSESCLVSGNEIHSTASRETTAGNGVHLWYCRDITVENNTVTGHRDGIYFEFVEDSRIAGNTCENNLRYGLHFMFSHRDTYVNNVFRNNGAGVAVMFSDWVVMLDNRFEHNWGSASYGILLKDIRDSEMNGNAFVHNSIGMYSEGSIRLTVKENLFEKNGYAIKLMASSTDNTFSSNNFIGNTFDVATNSRQNFNEFTGNYWSRYRGYDLNSDGIGDVPYRPVHVFSLLVEREPAGLVLLRSFFVDLVDVAERVMPTLTPPTLLDREPLIRPLVIAGHLVGEDIKIREGSR